MALKYKLDGASYTALDVALQAHYKQDGEDYIVDVEGLPKPEDTTALRNALTNAKAERQEAKDKLVSLEAEMDELRGKVAPPSISR